MSRILIVIIIVFFQLSMLSILNAINNVSAASILTETLIAVFISIFRAKRMKNKSNHNMISTNEYLNDIISLNVTCFHNLINLSRFSNLLSRENKTDQFESFYNSFHFHQICQTSWEFNLQQIFKWMNNRIV
jgi:hypothetical protein